MTKKKKIFEAHQIDTAKLFPLKVLGQVYEALGDFLRNTDRYNKSYVFAVIHV